MFWAPKFLIKKAVFEIRVVLLLSAQSEMIDYSLPITLARFMHMEMVAVVESDYPVSRFPVSQGTMFQLLFNSIL
jgi:hypothetical protein